MKTAEKLGGHRERRWSGKSGTAPSAKSSGSFASRAAWCCASIPTATSSAGFFPIPVPVLVDPHHRQPDPAALLRSLRPPGPGSRRNQRPHLRPDQANQSARRLQFGVPRDRRNPSRRRRQNVAGRRRRHDQRRPTKPHLDGADRHLRRRPRKALPCPRADQAGDFRNHGHLGHHARCHQGQRDGDGAAHQGLDGHGPLGGSEADQPPISFAT